MWLSLTLATPSAIASNEPFEKRVPDLDALPLPGIFDSKNVYRVDPYIEVAAQLQALGKEEAFRILGDFALRHVYMTTEGNSGYRSEPLLELCRMLFVARGDAPFRAPGLGVSGADPKLDPLEPIHLVDGIPFLTFHRSYLLAGSYKRN